MKEIEEESWVFVIISSSSSPVWDEMRYSYLSKDDAGGRRT